MIDIKNQTALNPCRFNNMQKFEAGVVYLLD